MKSSHIYILDEWNKNKIKMIMFSKKRHNKIYHKPLQEKVMQEKEYKIRLNYLINKGKI